MLESYSFVTRARTVDHLGRGQIADCPTAVSELWKNSYDAYARQVTLDIFDGEYPVAALCDDGHGMSRKEFIEKWLVVGTESKAGAFGPPQEDRNGLRYRPKQGQKGIGRLSSGYLGPLLLLVSKRKTEPFVAALVDWRVFENPYLLLHDVEIPVATFDDKAELPRTLELLQEQLVRNIWGFHDDPRSERIKVAWEQLQKDQMTLGDNFKSPTTKELIENLVVEVPFNLRHFERWSLWNGKSDSGTALFVGDINFDLRAQLALNSTDSTEIRARKRFFEILTSFSDPFPKHGNHDKNSNIDFDCVVRSWTGLECRTIIGRDLELDISNVEKLEHIVDGAVDEKGNFKGRIKAFGEWLEGYIEIPLSQNLDLPNRSNTRVGQFSLYIAAAEQELKNTTLPEEQHAHYLEMAKLYSGFMVYRDGLRVMPYGHPGSDLFDIEQRRSLHAGRQYWNLRRMFGRIAITRFDNPNLNDKAGREGLIDNRAVKGLKDIVENILQILGKRYFGTDSDIRKKIVPDLQNRHRRKQEEEERQKLETQRRTAFRKNLKKVLPAVSRLNQDIEELRFDIFESEEIEAKDLIAIRQRVLSAKDALNSFRLEEPPKELGAMEAAYSEYRSYTQQARSAIQELLEVAQSRIELIEPQNPSETVRRELDRSANLLRSRLRAWEHEAIALLKSEQERIELLVSERIKILFEQNFPLVEEVRTGRLKLIEALRDIELEKDRLDEENEEVFIPYIAALESLQASIDLAGLAAFGTEQLIELREELDRLNALAQLGITIEIIGHELEGFDSTIQSGLRELPDSIKTTEAYRRIKIGHDGLTDRLRFLSPLKLSGRNEKEWISGVQIRDYVFDFFRESLIDNSIEFSVTSQFLDLRLFENQSRIFPVFVNLVNNARYWVSQKPKGSRKICFDVRSGRVVVADTGPGVDEEDLKYLFTLFFTRRTAGGRGVGLYLCKVNLAAGGHKIFYAKHENDKVFCGANFIIEFAGAKIF